MLASERPTTPTSVRPTFSDSREKVLSAFRKPEPTTPERALVASTLFSLDEHFAHPNSRSSLINNRSSCQKRLRFFQEICALVEAGIVGGRLFTKIDPTCILVSAEGHPELQWTSVGTKLQNYVPLVGGEVADWAENVNETNPMSFLFLPPDAQRDILDRYKSQVRDHFQFGTPFPTLDAWYFKPDAKTVRKSLAMLGKWLFSQDSADHTSDLSLYNRRSTYDTAVDGSVTERVEYASIPFGSALSRLFFNAYPPKLDRSPEKASETAAIDRMREMIATLERGETPVLLAEATPTPAVRMSVSLAFSDNSLMPAITRTHREGDREEEEELDDVFSTPLLPRWTS